MTGYLETFQETFHAVHWTWVSVSGVLVVVGIAMIVGGFLSPLLKAKLISGGLGCIVIGLFLGWIGVILTERDAAVAARERAELAAKKAEDIANKWIQVAAEQSTEVDRWQREAAARKATAAQAQRAAAERARGLQEEIDALETRLRSEGVIPVAEAILAVRKAVDALP